MAAKRRKLLQEDFNLGSGSVSYPTDSGGTRIGTKIRPALFDPVFIEDYGAEGDGVTVDDTAFATAAALGVPVRLKGGHTYRISTQVVGQSNTFFYCADGIATLLIKTGSGGYNSKLLSGSKDAAGANVFLFSGKDNFGLSNIRFLADGVADAIINPIRVLGGCSSYGCRFENIIFEDIPMTQGGMLALNSIGEGSYVIENIFAMNCGTSEGSSYWTGTPQITVVEGDNDRVASAHSYPGVMRNIRCKNVLLAGNALSDYGQQTDLINWVGAESDRSGPYIDGVYADGIGEVLDLFCHHAIVRGVRAKNVVHYVLKLIHGAQYNDCEIEQVESVGLAAVILAGSSVINAETKYNNIRVGSVTGVGTVSGAPAGDTAAVMFSGADYDPKYNTVRVGNVYGNGTDMDYVVRDGGSDENWGNFVEVDRAEGWAVKFCDCPADNVRVKYNQSTSVRLVLGGTQSLTSGLAAVIDYSSAERDINSEAVTGSDKVRCKFPGQKRVHAQFRLEGHASGATVFIECLSNATAVFVREYVTNSTANLSFAIDGIVPIAENAVSAAAGDISIRVTYTGSGTPQLTANTSQSFLEVEG